MLNQNNIAIVCASDHNYVLGLLVTLKSIALSAKEVARLRFYVLDCGLTEHDKALVRNTVDAVTFHAIDLSLFTDLPEWRGSRVAYARLLIHEVLPDEDWVIYTDIDVLCRRDMGELWSQRNADTVLYAVPDGSGVLECSSGRTMAEIYAAAGRTPPLDPKEYFCSGLMMMNLRKLREMAWTDKVLVLVREKQQILRFADQDVFNWYFSGTGVRLLDYLWGEFSTLYGKRDTQKPRIIHFARQTPWKKKLTSVSWLWWKCLGEDVGLKNMRYRAKWLQWKIVGNAIGFHLAYGILFLLNKRAFLKRRWELLLY